MKKLIVFFAVVFTFIVFTSCASEGKRLSGNPSEILDVETYNKLQQQYKSIKNFQLGTAIVKKDKYGLIDENGNEILSCIYDTIYGIKKSFRIIMKDSLFGATNIDGEIIKQCVYSSVQDTKCDYLALKLNDKWGVCDVKGQDVTQYKYEDIRTFDDSSFVAKYNGVYGVSDYQNNTLIPFKYDNILYKFEKKYPVTVVQSGKYYGLYNSKYEQVLDCEYGEFMADSSGYVSVEKNGRKGLIEEETGKIMIPFEYKNMGNYSEGLIPAENLNEDWGYLDVNGKIVIPFEYSDAGNFSEGLAAVYKKTGKYMDFGFDRIETRKCGYIDKKGHVIIPFVFQQSYTVAMNEFHNGLAVQGYTNNYLCAKNYGYINMQGKWVVKPKYDDARDFHNGLAEVVRDGKYGYINTKGEEVIPCKYDEYGGYYVNDSTIQMNKDGIPYYFDLKGRVISKPE